MLGGHHIAGDIGGHHVAGDVGGHLKAGDEAGVIKCVPGESSQNLIFLDIHLGDLDVKYYKQNDCRDVNDAWQQIFCLMIF